MTVKEKRLVSILSAVLAILFGAVLVILSARYRSAQARMEAQAQQQEDLQQEALRPEYTNFSYQNGSAFLAFALDGNGEWYWENEPDFPLDDAHLRSIQAQFQDLTPTEELPLPDDLSEYGLDQPPLAQITAVTGEEETVQLSLGDLTEDGTGRYALSSRSPQRLLVVPNALYEALQMPIYQMCRLPELPRIKEAQMRSIVLQGPPPEEGGAPSLTVLTAYQGDDGTTWRTGGADVTAKTALTALLEDLTHMTLSACIDYHPSAAAATLCGFDAPVTMTVRFVEDGGEEDAFVLSVGTVDLTGEGRYVRMGEEAAIYLMQEESLGALLTLATEGMEGLGGA